MGILINVFFISVNFVTGNGLVLLQRSTSLKLPYDFPVATTFYRLHAVDEKLGVPPRDPLDYRILKSVVFPPASRPTSSGRGLFAIDEHTGSLMLSPHRKHSVAEFIGSTFALDIIAVHATRTSEDTARATVMIDITNNTFTQPDCTPRAELCFADMHYQIPETVLVGSNLGNVRPIPYAKLCPNSFIKYRLSYDDSIPAVIENERLKTRRSFDFEESTHHVLNISCEIQSKTENAVFHFQINFYVLDVDDNPPYIQNGSRTNFEIDATQITPGIKLPFSFIILDADTPSVNKVTVNKTDPLNLFRLKDPTTFASVQGACMLMVIGLVPNLNFQFPDTTYNVTVIFNDTSLVGSPGDNQVIKFHLLITNNSLEDKDSILRFNEFKTHARIFRHSALHARVIQPVEILPHENYNFSIVQKSNKRFHKLEDNIFGVTPKTGIIYIMDEAALARSTAKIFALELTWRNKNVTDSGSVVTIRVLDSDKPNNGSDECGTPSNSEYASCAIHRRAESCTANCGRGATERFCHWRSHSSQRDGVFVKEYATCSPHLQTCPDGTCDELEEMDRFLCPQDCAKMVLGSGMNNDNGKGVKAAASSCSCIRPNKCTCLPFYSTPVPVSREQVKVYKETPNIKYKPLEVRKSVGGCNAECVTMVVVVSLIVSGLIVVAGILMYRRWRSYPKDEEHPSVTTPLNSSTYLVARGLMNYPLHENVLQQVKLEFPQDQLTLEETLGEGEFGKVVKGKAKNISGLSGTTTVAVKMLKDGSSSSERRDLVSELNLLKEISHPNVIRLLGASTDDDGQLYIIMEYAEHGSLITYLRKMKSTCTEMNLPELIAFALQVAKGMEYLASMKVVHRDLAARNVLVAAGKILKISDFGLSRDVYERDTYLKMSKSKVPVKWMAIESLETQLYTTKSDVWSFGILLWEIITIGGCPYPGIPTERLFELLKEGYRMPRPDSCPLDLYELMKVCWLERPNERPHFKELVQKIEFILEEISHQRALCDENIQRRSKRVRSRDDASMLQQLTSFPRLTVQEIGPYENHCLLSSNEFSV